MNQGSTIRFGASTRKYKVDVGQEKRDGDDAGAAGAVGTAIDEPPQETAEQWALRKQQEALKAVHLKAHGSATGSTAASSAPQQQTQQQQEIDGGNGDDDADVAEEDIVDQEDPLEAADRKRKRTEHNRAKREAKKQAKKQYWADKKQSQKSAKFRKKNFVAKEKSSNQRLADICGQPVW